MSKFEFCNTITRCSTHPEQSYGITGLKFTHPEQRVMVLQDSNLLIQNKELWYYKTQIYSSRTVLVLQDSNLLIQNRVLVLQDSNLLIQNKELWYYRTQIYSYRTKSYGITGLKFTHPEQRFGITGLKFTHTEQRVMVLILKP
jgi:uncharacterized protein YneR